MAARVVSVLILLVVLAAPAGAQAPSGGLEALVARLGPGQPTDVRMEAARALGASRDPRALEPLLAALGDDNRDVRWAAIEALGELGDRRAVPRLVEYLKRPEAYRWGKRLAASALGAIGDPAAVEPLAALLGDEDPFVRRLSALALLRIGGGRGLEAVAGLVDRAGTDETLGAVRRELALAREGAARAAERAAPAASAERPPLQPHEWGGLRVGRARLADARERFGAPLQETSDFALFRGEAVRGAIRADSVVVNAGPGGAVESIFVFPVWGTLDRDVHALLGRGRLMTYGEFLQATGRTAYGAGTKAGGKLHYVPPDLMSESYPDAGVLVIYDGPERVASERLVKLLIVY
jgi:hypothetical protein